MLLDTSELLNNEITNDLSALSKFWDSISSWCATFLLKFLAALLVFFIGWWLSNVLTKFIKKMISRSRADATVVSFLSSVINTILKILVVMVAASTLGVDVTAFVATLGAASVALGFALKNTVENFTSGVIIMFNRPFKVGDYMEIDGLSGTVKKIELMYTTFLTLDSKTILIPNATISNSNIINYSTAEKRRLDIDFYVGYTTDLEKARKVILSITQSHPKILQDPMPVVAVTQHGESSITVTSRTWVVSSDYLAVKEELMETVKNAFDDNDISIPFNQLDVHIIN